MSFRLLALVAFLALAPLAHAQAPTDITLTAGAVKGTIKEDNQDVIPYKGNATVDLEVRVGCAAIIDAMAASANPVVEHVEVHVEDPPAWLLAEHAELDLDPSACLTSVTGAAGYVTATGAFPFGVAASAPGILTQTMNLTAHVEGGEEESNVAQVTFAVQFHANYTLTPSVSFPHTVTGPTADFTVTITNNANTRGMVMIEEMHVSSGTFSGLTSTVYEPPETKTFQVTFKAPAGCWTSAKVDFKAFAHYLLLDQRAGSYKDGREYTWDFTNGVACTPGEDGTKASPLGGWVLVTSILGAALAARRRVL